MADIIHLSRYRTTEFRGNTVIRDGKSLLDRWRDRAAMRRMLRDELLSQPDRVLADAGWTRNAAQTEASKPFWRA